MSARFNLDPIHFKIENNHGFVKLNQKEYQIFYYIYSGISTRYEIMRLIWDDCTVDPKCFNVHLSTLRKKIDSIEIYIEVKNRKYYSIRNLEDSRNVTAIYY